MGVGVILPAMLQQVDPGDIVLLVPEYLILLEEDGLGRRSGAFAIATGQGLNQVPPKQLVRDWIGIGVPSLRALVKSTSDLMTLGKFSGYYDDPLTAAGDPTVDKQRQGDWWQLAIKRPATAHAIQRIEQFRTEVETQGGELVLSLPWVYGKPTRKPRPIFARQLRPWGPLRHCSMSQRRSIFNRMSPCLLIPTTI